MLFAILMVLYVLVCLILCLVILIQSDKGGGISGAFGGGLASANALLGTQDTANILTRGTTIFATAYLVLCIVISLFVARTASEGAPGKSVLKERAEQQESPASILQGGGLKLAEDEGAGGGATAGQEGGGLPLDQGTPPQPVQPAAPQK